MHEDWDKLALAVRSMQCSMMMEMITRTKQTTATAHVAVSSKDRPPAPPAMLYPLGLEVKKVYMEKLSFWNKRGDILAAAGKVEHIYMLKDAVAVMDGGRLKFSRRWLFKFHIVSGTWSADLVFWIDFGCQFSLQGTNAINKKKTKKKGTKKIMDLKEGNLHT